MSDADLGRFEITSEEFQWACAEFTRHYAPLSQKLHQHSIPGIITNIDLITEFSILETGIKLGLLIAECRAEQKRLEQLKPFWFV
jgi:hypothetical protein